MHTGESNESRQNHSHETKVINNLRYRFLVRDFLKRDTVEGLKADLAEYEQLYPGTLRQLRQWRLVHAAEEESKRIDIGLFSITAVLVLSSLEQYEYRNPFLTFGIFCASSISSTYVSTSLQNYEIILDAVLNSAPDTLR